MEKKAGRRKNWSSFKTYFASAHEELVESTQTARSAGFQTNNANTIFQTVTAINNLANATLADRESMAALTLTVSTQTVALAEANLKLVSALAKITALKRELGAARLSPNPRPGPRIPRDPNTTYTHYCWTHGPTFSHPSSECQRKAEGHKDEATMTNKLGARAEKWVYRPVR